MTEAYSEGDRAGIPRVYTEPVARYVGKSAVDRGTETREWQVPEAPVEDIPTPTVEEEDSTVAKPASPPSPQSIDDFPEAQK